MTALQAKILHVIVRVAKLDIWRVPTGEKLANLLSKEGINIKPRTANDHVRRLQREQSCFDEQGKTRYVKAELLCTEPESAVYLLVLERLSKNSEGRVPKAFLHTRLKGLFHLDPQAMETMFTYGKRTGYLEEIAVDRAYIRVGRRTIEQHLYLQLLAPKLDLSPLDNKPHENRPGSVLSVIAW